MNGKYCTLCLEDKQLSDYPKCARAPDGLQYRCRSCCAKASSVSRAKRDHEEAKAVKQAWYKKNQEKILARYATKREERRKTTAEWDVQHPDQKKLNIRKSRLRRFYGLTLQDYDGLKSQQDNRCAICGVIPDGNAAKSYDGFHVDHNHVTGRVRGLLCGNCNTGIGMLKESEVVLQSAIQYLRHHSE